MSPSALLITGAVFIPLIISVAFAYISYRQLRLRRAKYQGHHHRWPSQNAGNTKARPMQTGLEPTAACSGWPRNLRDEQYMDTKFLPTCTFGISRLDTSKCKPSPQCPAPVRISVSHSCGDGAVQGLARKKTTAYSEEEIGFPYGAGDQESRDPARGIWRGLEARDSLYKQTDADHGKSKLGKCGLVDENSSRASTQCPLGTTAAPSQRAVVEGSRVDRVAKQYAEIAEKLRFVS